MSLQTTDTMPESVAPESEGPEKKNQDREVTITVGQASNGRIPISILVVPTHQFDAGGGIFVDFRLGKKDPSNMPVVFDDSPAYQTSIESGDAAVAELARIEIAAGETASEPEVEEALEEPGAEPTLEAPPPSVTKRKAMDGKYPIVSHQVGPAIKLIVGQSESFRAELAEPAAPTNGERWYARARFSTPQGHDLRSSWALV